MNFEDFHNCLVNLHYLSAVTTVSKFADPMNAKMSQALREDVDRCRILLYQFWALINPHQEEIID